VLEIAVALALAAALGWLRPRWSTLGVALVPTGLAFAWLLMHEDVPGERTTAIDLAWFAGMSLLAGLGFVAACAAGVLARRLGRGRRRAVRPGR
jgi:hypothetical protein